MDKEKELTGQETTGVETGEPEREDENIREVDLGTLADLTGADMLTINRMIRKRGNIDASPEFTLEYAFYAAMQATGLPLEFFHMLSMKDSMKIKTRVNYFLLY